MKQALDYVNQNGGNAKEVCEKMLADNGLSMNDILNQLR